MARDSNLYVRFPDGTVRYGSYNDTSDVAGPRLFTYLVDALRYEPRLTDWTDWRAGEGEPVDLATDYGGGFQWKGTATPTRLTSGYEPYATDRGTGVMLSGYCPMGCGQTLHVDVANPFGKIVCLTPACPRPSAVTDLLLMPEVIEHRVTLTSIDFQIVHPLRERFGDEIGRCRLDEWLKGRVGPPQPPGVYLAEQQSDGVWVFTLWTD